MLLWIRNKLNRPNTFNKLIKNPARIEPILEKANQSVASQPDVSNHSNYLTAQKFYENIIQRHESFKDDNNYTVANELENGSYFGEVKR